MSEAKRKICIVDDDPFLLDMYSLKFQQAGYDVSCFTKSDEALDALRAGAKYSGVLLDLVMPQTDGFEMLRIMREENLCDADTTIVILSKQWQDKDIERAEEFGIDGYLIKANTLPSEVLEYVSNLLDKKAAPAA